MPFPELEKYKRQSPRLADTISALEAYLRELLDHPSHSIRGLDHAAFDIVPILVAKALGIDEGLAHVLLGYFEEAGIIAHRYDVYCPNTEQFIEKFESKENLPNYIVCPFEVRTEHRIDEYFIELVFNFSPKFIQDHKMVLSLKSA